MDMGMLMELQEEIANQLRCGSHRVQSSCTVGSIKNADSCTLNTDTTDPSHWGCGSMSDH